MFSSPRTLGMRGELLARHFLEEKGLRMITTNWSCKLGEIDLIMHDGLTRVFVEVRLRSFTQYGAGYDTVTRQKQRKLIRTAQLYQQRERYWGDVRFDVVSITLRVNSEPLIEHIEHAFAL